MRTARRLNRAAAPPWLHLEVARRMAERLSYIRLQPECVIDWGAFVGGSRGLLARAYPKARLLAVEPDAERREATAAALQPRWWSPQRWAGPGASPAALIEPELRPGQAQLVWANMSLHAAADPLQVMRAWERALAVDGFLMFSTLGPGTLVELRTTYDRQGWPPPFAPFVDMHDLGDMMLEAGLADPVMDQEQLTLTFAGADALLAELRLLGGNAHPRRGAGLRTARWRRQLVDALEAGADGAGRIRMSFEIVYGHAFKPLPRARLAAETRLPLSDLRAMVRRGRPRP
jgi:malonyl-CoA O-methyltransferase